MLKNGTKVQISKTTYSLETMQISPFAGVITVVTGYDGLQEHPQSGEMLEAYLTKATGDLTICRDSIYPLDDEPCEEGFLEEFKDLINDTVSVTTDSFNSSIGRMADHTRYEI